MRPQMAACLVLLLYVLHQDFWFWREARPLVFGFLPIGLFYHAAFTAACSIVLWLLVKRAWPAHLESEPLGPAATPGRPPSRPWRFGESRRSSPNTRASVGRTIGPTGGDAPSLRVGPIGR